MLYQLGDDHPDIHESCFIAPDAQIIGQVQADKMASIWFGCVLRGDIDRIAIGENSNIQDQSMLHTDAGIEMRVGANVTVGHKVMLHGCQIADNVLVGMNSVILNHAKIGEYSIIGANSLVTERKEIPAGVLVMGSPAKIIREVTDEERRMIELSAQHYVSNGQRFKKDLKVFGAE